MKTSGIARKIDRLGRIVIPKEIRRALRIASGDYVDMHVEGSAIMIRKTEVLSRYTDISEAYVQTVYQKIGEACFICNRDSVIAARGPAVRSSQDIGDGLRARILKGEFFYTETPPFINFMQEDRQYYMQCVIPLNCEGEVYGALVVYSLKPHTLSEHDKIFLTGAGELLCGQLRQE